MADKLETWRMIGASSYLWNRRMWVKPGQLFTAYEKDMPTELRRMVVPVLPEVKPRDVVPEVKEEKPAEQTKPVAYRMRSRNAGEYYDILDSNGKKVNEQKLSEEEAVAMLNSLKS